MELKPIRTVAEYEAALEHVSPYFDNEPEAGTAGKTGEEVMG